MKIIILWIIVSPVLDVWDQLVEKLAFQVVKVEVTGVYTMTFELKVLFYTMYILLKVLYMGAKWLCSSFVGLQIKKAEITKRFQNVQCIFLINDNVNVPYLEKL